MRRIDLRPTPHRDERRDDIVAFVVEARRETLIVRLAAVVGGYLLTHLGRVPLVGERFEIDGLDVEILDVERRRVHKVRLSRHVPPEGMAAVDKGSREPAGDRVGK